MPRVNPHLQRRLAARRERVRQRSADGTSYEFAPAETELVESTLQEAPAAPVLPQPRPRAERTTTTAPRAGRAVKTFAESASEYGYVARDLRRIAIVIAVLMLVIFGLFFIVQP